MKPKYPGLRHMTFYECEEFTRLLFERIGLKPNDHIKVGYGAFDANYLRNTIAEIYNQMVRAQEEEADGNRH